MWYIQLGEGEEWWIAFTKWGESQRNSGELILVGKLLSHLGLPLFFALFFYFRSYFLFDIFSV
jgi:hypothetical protein